MGKKLSLVYEADEASGAKSERKIVVQASFTYRLFRYLSLAHGVIATEEHCAVGEEYLKELFMRLRVVIHETKEDINRTRVMDHIRFIIDTEQMRIFLSARKIKKVQSLAKNLLLLGQMNARLVPLELVRHLCGVCVSLPLAVPLARFDIPSLYVDMSLAERMTRKEKTNQKRKAKTRPYFQQQEKKDRKCGVQKNGWNFSEKGSCLSRWVFYKDMAP